MKLFGLALAASAVFLAGSVQAVTYANWTFNDGTGTDSSGYGHDLWGSGTVVATPLGGPSANSVHNFWSWPDTSGWGFPTDNFTLGGYFKMEHPAYTAADFSAVLATAGGDSPTLYLGVRKVDADNDEWVVSLGAYGSDPILATFPVTPSTPQHIEVTRESGDYTVWVDNALVAGPISGKGGFNWGGFHVGMTPGGGTHPLGLFADITLTDPIAHSPEAKITTFGLPGMPATIDQTANTIYWPVTYESNPAALAAQFTISSGATNYDANPGAGGNVITSGTVRNFTSPVHYWVKSSDGLILNDYTVTVYHTPVSSDKDILTFAGVPGLPGTIGANTVDFDVPNGMSLGNLTPIYTTSTYFGGYATGSPASGATVDFSGVSHSVVYTITAQDHSTKQYTVTAHTLPPYPVTINLAYNNGGIDGVPSYKSPEKGSASSVAPLLYQGSAWNNGGYGRSGMSSLKDSAGAFTGVGVSQYLRPHDAGNGWTGLSNNKFVNAGLMTGSWWDPDYGTFNDIFTISGLDTTHSYNLAVVLQDNTESKDTTFKYWALEKQISNGGGDTDWVESENYALFQNIVPMAGGVITLQSKVNSDWAPFNGWQLHDNGVRASQEQGAAIGHFSIPGAGAATIDGTSISVPMKTATDLTGLLTVFTMSPGASCKNVATGLPIVSGVTPVNFTGPVVYRITSEDNSTTTDYTVTVNLLVPTGRIHVNITPGDTADGLVGPAPFEGLGKVWNNTPGAKSGSNLVDEDGLPTGAGFNFNNFEGTGWWQNPSLKMLHGAVWWWSQNDRGEGVGVCSGEINGLATDKKYDLYIGSFWGDSFSHGTFTVNGTSQDLDGDGQGTDPAGWVQGGNYVQFLNVAPDVNGKILITATATPKNGGDQPLMINGFQLLDTGIKSTNCTMLSFGHGAVITGTDIAWTIPYGTSLAAAAPTFTMSALATCSHPSGFVPTPNLSTGPVHYIVTAEDGIHFKDYTVTATVRPSPLTTMACWYEASKGVTTNENGVVLAWADQSGNGHDATSGGGTPTLAASQLNGNPAVQFRSSWLNVDIPLFTAEQYLVLKAPGSMWNGSGCFMGPTGPGYNGGNYPPGQDWRWWRIYDMRNGDIAFWPDPAPAGVSKNGTPVDPQWGDNFAYPIPPINQYMVLKIDANTTQYGGAGSPALYQIGKGADVGTIDFDVVEIIGYDSVLGSVDEAMVGSYLAAKYGIQTAYPPLTTTHTVHLTITPDGAGNFTISGTVSPAQPVVHLWKSNDLSLGAAGWSDTGDTADASSGTFTFFPPRNPATDGPTKTFYMVK